MSAFYDQGVFDSMKYSISFNEDGNCETCNYIFFLFVMLISNLCITSMHHVLPQKYMLVLFARDSSHLFFLRTNASF